MIPKIHAFLICVLVALIVSCRPVTALEDMAFAVMSEEEMKKLTEVPSTELLQEEGIANRYCQKGETLYYKYHDYASALKCFETALQLRPNFDPAVLMKGYCLIKLGKSEDALQVLRYTPAPTFCGVPVLLLARIETLSEMKRYDEALALCSYCAGGDYQNKPHQDVMSNLGPRGCTCYQYQALANVYLKMGKKKEAVEQAKLLYYHGILQPNKDAVERAVALLKECNQPPPSDVVICKRDNEKVFATLSAILDRGPELDKVALEDIFGLPFFDDLRRSGKEQFCNYYCGTALFPGVIYSQIPERHSIMTTMSVNFERALIERSDLEKEFSDITFEPAKKASICGIGWAPPLMRLIRKNAVVTFQFEPSEKRRVASIAIAWDMARNH